MPPPRKVDLLPAELRQWLQEELAERGFADYEQLAEDLSFRLEEAGLELRIGKSAIHAYAQDFKAYSDAQQQAQDEMRTFLREVSLEDEIDVTSALFQQLTTIAWKLQMAMADPHNLPDPRGLKDLTSALTNLIRSTTLRDEILKAERAAQSSKLEAAVEAGDIDRAAAERAREIMGFG